MKPKLTKSEFSLIDKEYYSYKYGIAKAKVSRRMKLREIGSPEIIYTHTRRVSGCAVYYSPVDIRKNLDWEELYDAFRDPRKAAALLKDRKLAARLRKEGGTCCFIQDHYHVWVILLWVGKNPKQVRRILKKREAELACERALERIKTDVGILLEHNNPERVGSEVTSVLMKKLGRKFKDGDWIVT